MNLDSNIEFDFRRFFRWWGRELAFLAPEKLRQWLSERSGLVVLAVNGEQLHVGRIHNGENQPLVSVPFDDQIGTLYQRLKAIQPDLEKARYILRLNRQQAIGKILYLPLAAKENLDQVIEFEMDRYMPFKADQVYFATKILGKVDGERLKVFLAVTPQQKLNALVAEFQNAGIYPAVADYAEMPNDFEQDFEPYNLLPEALRPVGSPVARFLNWAIGLTTLLLFIAVLVFPVWHEGRQVEALRQQIDELEKDARFVQSKQLEIDEIVDQTERLLKTKNSMPPLTELINNLSKLIPDDTWLTHLQFNEGRLQLQGQSPTASVLIGVLEASPLFVNARFVSPLTQDRRTGMERFQISVEVETAKESGDAE